MGKETSFEKPRYDMPGRSKNAPLRNGRARAAKIRPEMEAKPESGNQKARRENRTGRVSAEAQCAQGAPRGQRRISDAV